MSNFKVGDIVKCTKAYDFNNKTVGKIGRIINAFYEGCTVEFFEHIDGHDGDCNGREGYCWNFHTKCDYYLEKLDELDSNNTKKVYRCDNETVIIIKNKFDWHDFRNTKIAVNCKNDEEAKSFFYECIKRGIFPHFNDPQYYGEETCYKFSNDHDGDDLNFADRSFYEKRGYTVLNWADIEGVTK